MFIKRVVSTAVAAVVLGVCGSAMADSDTGGANNDAVVDLNFNINIPGVLRFRVGSNGNTVDTISFDPTANDLENGNTVAGTGGNLMGGSVAVDVFSNRGIVTITEDNAGVGGGIGAAMGDVISYAAIITADTGSGTIPPPQLTDTGGASSSVALTGTNRTDRESVWTYTLDTSGIDSGPGVYTGTVTYTASTP